MNNVKAYRSYLNGKVFYFSRKHVSNETNKDLIPSSMSVRAATSSVAKRDPLSFIFPRLFDSVIKSSKSFRHVVDSLIRGFKILVTYFPKT